MQLDQTDKRIMAILERDGRISAAELGRQIGLSRTAVQDRISRLESNGTITGYHARLSPSGDSLIRAILFVKIAIRPCEKALLWLSGLEGVQEVASLSGDIDAVVRCAVPDLNALTKLNDRIGASELITSSTSSIILRQL
ncbi:Lrp/AsnC family transcriptional regulator [Cohaesibacter haloalkalitolerans]|uniref:Lrp/AsnC family transcriptional regulator n=1 Tax=Cohaesibacter haloalkalitolerans TaxID=1162980 RepID=UPI000E64FCED|nr:Lrp/AsnC family transcriptional regulator [Cohaesibacter haloalkalitolerans]